MALMLKKKNETVILDNTNEVFEGTPFANEPFMVEIKKISRSERINLLSSSVGEDGMIKQGDYSRDLFVLSVCGADGFVNENQEPLNVEDGVALMIWDNGSDLLVDAIKDKIQSFTAVEEKKSETLEIDSPTIPAGQ